MDSTTLIGRVSKKPELRYSKDSKPILRIGLICGENDFVFVKVFGCAAELGSYYLDAGDKISVYGKWSPQNYKDAHGNWQYKVEFEAEEICYPIDAKFERKFRMASSDNSQTKMQSTGLVNTTVKPTVVAANVQASPTMAQQNATTTNVVPIVGKTNNNSTTFDIDDIISNVVGIN